MTRSEQITLPVERGPERISVGSIVTVREEGYPADDVFQIISEEEKRREENLSNGYYISNASPLGAALMGKQVGEEAIVKIPGKVKEEEVSFKVEIIHVNNEERI